MTVITVFVMMLSGGFVAGTKAGFIMNTFPSMNGQWLPDGLLAMQPVWINLFENAVTIQFTHRLLALLVFIVVISCALLARQHYPNSAYKLLLGVVSLQISLGIAALVYKVPLWLGAGHQAGAVLLLATALLLAHQTRKARPQ